MTKDYRHRKIVVTIVSIIGLLFVCIALSFIVILYNNSLALGKLKDQCSELGIGTHAITYQGVATTLECDAGGKMYLPARN